jgi:hypothetical protein
MCIHCHGNGFTELLPSNRAIAYHQWEDTHMDAQTRWESRLTTEELLEMVFCLQSDLKLYKEDNSLFRREGLISKHINGFGMNKNFVMSSSDTQNQE